MKTNANAMSKAALWSVYAYGSVGVSIYLLYMSALLFCIVRFRLMLGVDASYMFCYFAHKHPFNWTFSTAPYLLLPTAPYPRRGYLGYRN